MKKIMHNFSWSSLGSIGRSPASKLSIIIPFLGYIVLLQDSVISFLAPLGMASEVKLGIGFYFLYFGLFIFGLGSFIFHVASPEPARRFRSADEYVERLHPLITSSDLMLKLNFILEKSAPESDARNEAYLYKNALSSGVAAHPHQSAIMFSLREYFEIEDYSNRAMRLIVFFLFCFGFLLISVPSMIAFTHVVKSFIQNYM